MIEYIPQALTSLSAATNIISSLMSLRDFSKYAATFTELQGHIIQANANIIAEQQAHSVLAAEVEELKKEVVRLKDWSAQKEQYTRKLIAEGIFAYVDNNSVTPFENSHKLCCNCFDKTVPSTLQQNFKRGRTLRYELHCPNGCPPISFDEYIDDK